MSLKALLSQLFSLADIGSCLSLPPTWLPSAPWLQDPSVSSASFANEQSRGQTKGEKETLSYIYQYGCMWCRLKERRKKEKKLDELTLHTTFIMGHT